MESTLFQFAKRKGSYYTAQKMKFSMNKILHGKLHFWTVLVTLYRLVLLQPTCLKIHENLIFDHRFDFREQKNILDNNQLEFTLKNLCINQLISITHSIFHTFNTCPLLEFVVSLHKEWNFPLRISSINVTKSAVSSGLVMFTEEIHNGKLHFLCSTFSWSYWELAIKSSIAVVIAILKKIE